MAACRQRQSTLPQCGQLGVQISANGSRWLLETALTGGHVGESSTAWQRALLARAAGLVVQTDDLDVHLGLSSTWSFRTPQEPGSQTGIDYSTTPEYDIQNRSRIDTGTIPTSSTLGAGPEFGLAYGPLWIQGGVLPHLGEPHERLEPLRICTRNELAI
jgi:phosphate-selective porin OprO and OprP